MFNSYRFIFFFGLCEDLSTPVNPEKAEPIRAKAKEAINAIIFKELFGSSVNSQFCIEGQVKVEDSKEDKHVNVSFIK